MAHRLASGTRSPAASRGRGKLRKELRDSIMSVKLLKRMFALRRRGSDVFAERLSRQLSKTKESSIVNANKQPRRFTVSVRGLIVHVKNSSKTSSDKEIAKNSKLPRPPNVTVSLFN